VLIHGTALTRQQQGKAEDSNAVSVIYFDVAVTSFRSF